MTKAEKTKKHIIEVSSSLFNQKGFSGTSLSDIIQASGVSKGGLYGHFRGGKLEIAKASFSYAVEIVYGEVGKRTRIIQHAVDKLKAVIYFYREHIFDSPVRGGCPIQNTYVQSIGVQPELEAMVKEVLLDWQSRIAYTIQKGIDRSQIRSGINGEDMAIRMISYIQGALLVSKAMGDAKAFDTAIAPFLKELENIRL